MKQTMKYTTRMWGIYAVLMLLSLFFIMSVTNTAVQVALCVALLAGFGLLLFNEGGYNGEKACTLAALLDRQIKEGRSVDREQYAQTWSKKNALRMFVMMILPFVLIALINLAVAPLYPTAEEAEVQEEEVSSTGFIVEDVEEPGEEDAPATNWVNVITRIVYSPYCALYGHVSASLLNWLFLPLGLLLPACDVIGYLCGPRLREKKLKDIAKGKRRKLRKMKREREANRGPKAVV